VLAPRNLDYIENNKIFDAKYVGMLKSMRFCPRPMKSSSYSATRNSIIMHDANRKAKAK
jgi:hypothetical protein